MKKLQLLFILLVAGLSTTSSISAQDCFSLGGPVEEMTPLLKSTPAGVCPNPAQAIEVCDCPAGYVAVGYVGQEGNGYGGMVISQFTLRCRELNLDGTLGAMVDVTCANGSAAGSSVDGPIDAGAGQALVGFEVRIGCAIDGIQGFSKPIQDIADGTPNSTSTAVTAIGGMGGAPQPAMYAPDGNVIVGMRTYEDPGNNISAGVAWRYAPINTIACPTSCSITSISLSNASACDDNGTTDIATDDFFTADVTVSFVNAPATGTLNLSGLGANESVAVGSIGGSSHTFNNVQLPTVGGSVALTASFSADPACSSTEVAGVAPGTCSPDATGIPTMSEWGLILFALIIFTLSVVFGTQYQQALATANGPASGSSLTKLPFQRAAFFGLLPWVYLAITLVFALSVILFGYELTNADIPGSIAAGAIIAYLLHYVKTYNKQ